MEKSPVIFIDLGDELSVCSTLYVAGLVSQSRADVEFYLDSRFMNFAQFFPKLKVTPIEVGETLSPRSSLVLDFTPIGRSQLATRFYTPTTKYYSVDHYDVLNAYEFQTKLDFVQLHLNQKNILTSSAMSHSLPGVLTFSAKLAANLNMQNIPTVEICSESRTPGSFLPGSLVIKADRFAVQDSEDLQMIFEFYQQNKIEELMLNRNVLEADWQLILYKFEQSNNSVVSKKFPISPTEDFFEGFLKLFMSSVASQNFSMDRLLRIASGMDYIDFDMTVDFLRKSLKLCIEDVESESFPVTGSYWNLVRNHLEYDVYHHPQKVLKALNQALIGLDLFTRIEERQRRAVGMH